jgi:hypothetical protein
MTSIRQPLAAGAAAGALLSVLASACGDADAHFTVNYAPDYRRAASTVSVFGVFKDGRVNPDSWEDLGPILSSPFGGACPVGDGPELATKDLSLFQAIDDYAREDGVTDTLLAQLAPSAQGEMILVFTVSGTPPKRQAVAGDPGPGAAPALGQPNALGGRRSSNMGRPMHSGYFFQPRQQLAFELSASLFSVQARRSVAQVTLQYSGDSAEDALNKFAAKLREALPGATCRGWNAMPLDGDKIRALIEHPTTG